MPTAVESIANLGAVLVQLPQSKNPGSNLSKTPANFTIGGRSSGPLIEHPGAGYAELMSLLRPALSKIGAALQKTLPPNARSIQVFGVGTDHATLSVLNKLITELGFHCTIGACDGSVRQGFAGPTAVLHAHAGISPGLFLQQVGSALASKANVAGDDWTL